MDLDGVLFFPVTPFSRDGEPDLEKLAGHIDQRLTAGPGAVFVACGTGELHALSAHEHRAVVAAAVAAVDGRVPVVSGVGGPLPVAVEQARAARDVGADGLLLLPPYLVAGPPRGLVQYVERVARATDLPVVVYQRGTAVFSPESAAEVARIPTVVGLKDGLGDIGLMQRIVTAVRGTTGDTFRFFNGLATAELTAPAYRGIGVNLYSSAAFGFVPEIATAYHRALDEGDDKVVHELLAEFFEPLVALRDQVPGYAVSLVKAGITLRGLDVGGVRPPLVDPSAQHEEELARLIERGLALVTP